MDYNITNKLFKERIKSLIDTNFQEFINFFFKLLYGNDFKSIKQKKDQGADGIIESQKKIIAVYAPEVYVLKNFKKKISLDYKSFCEFWKSDFPNWVVIYNREILSNQYKFVKSLYEQSELWGIEEIIKELSGLQNSKQMKIGEFLGIDREFMSRDIMKEIIDDLIRIPQITKSEPEYKDLQKINEKLEINFGQNDIEETKRDFDLCLEDFVSLGNVLSGYEDGDITKLKSNIISNFNSRSGSFKKKFYEIIDYYLKSFNNDDEYKYYIKVILFYLFEQCLIGKKTESELN